MCWQWKQTGRRRDWPNAMAELQNPKVQIAGINFPMYVYLLTMHEHKIQYK